MMESADLQPAPPKAALLVIGNEILSGKVRDENISYLAAQLFQMGWEFREVSIVGDLQTDIVSSLSRLLEKSDYVFTSGGVGPTHDDITLESIAKALGKRLVLSPVLERLLKKFYDSEILTPAQQRLALVVEGSTLHYGEDSVYPQMVIERVYPLPGIPDLFRKKFQELKSLWPVLPSPSRHCFKMVAMETELASSLTALAEEHIQVSLGSYPTERDGTWHLELVLESRCQDSLEMACRALRGVLQNRDISYREES